MNHFIYVDIETIPAGDPIDISTIQPPSNMSKPETIAKWRAEQAPKLVDELYRKRALNSMEGEIVCIGWAIGDEEVRTCTAHADYLNEFDLIDSWSNWLQEDIDIYDSVIWIGHNALNFDMPWLWRRAVKYDLPWLKSQIRLDRYKNNIHDTMKIWAGADFKDYTSLDKLASWLGLGSQNGSGSEVYDNYLKGDYEAIAEHCKSDVELVRAVYKKIMGGGLFNV